MITKSVMALAMMISTSIAHAGSIHRCDEMLEPERIHLDALGKVLIPEFPKIGFIEGDGIGREIMPTAMKVIDAAVATAYGARHRIAWREIMAGEKAMAELGTNLPDASLERMRKLAVVLKGPMNTPIGEGFRSLNVAIRKELKLYSCERPIRHYPNVPSPVCFPEKVRMRLFRENLEDVYAGIEFFAGTRPAHRAVKAINKILRSVGSDERLSKDAAVGIKFATKAGTENVMRRALEYAIHAGEESLTIVHKANIQKATDGGFLKWARELALREYRDSIITEDELRQAHWIIPPGKVVLKDRIADNMFQQVLLKPEQYHVIVAQNLNGDYLSDALAAQVGGLGIAPGANYGARGAVFEATHGTAPDIAGQNLANPTSLILSGGMMLEYLGWDDAAEVIDRALTKVFEDRVVTGDFRAMANAQIVGTREFGDAVIARMGPR